MYAKQVAVAVVPLLMAANAQTQVAGDIDFEFDRVPPTCITQCTPFYNAFNICEETNDLPDHQNQQEFEARKACYCKAELSAQASSCAGCIQGAQPATQQGAVQFDATGITGVLATCGWTASNGNTAGQPGQPGSQPNQPGSQPNQPAQPGQPGQPGTQPNPSGVPMPKAPLPSAAPGKPGNTNSTTPGKASPSGSGAKPTSTNGQKVNGAAGIGSVSVIGMGAAALFAAMMLQ